MRGRPADHPVPILASLGYLKASRACPAAGVHLSDFGLSKHGAKISFASQKHGRFPVAFLGERFESGRIPCKRRDDTEYMIDPIGASSLGQPHKACKKARWKASLHKVVGSPLHPRRAKFLSTVRKRRGRGRFLLPFDKALFRQRKTQRSKRSSLRLQREKTPPRVTRPPQRFRLRFGKRALPARCTTAWTKPLLFPSARSTGTPSL